MISRAHKAHPIHDTNNRNETMTRMTRMGESDGLERMEETGYHLPAAAYTLMVVTKFLALSKR